MKKIFFVTTLLSVFACHPSVEEWLERARLADENNLADKAEVFRHHAYEESLPRHFLILGRKEKFIAMKSSPTGQTIAFMKKRNAEDNSQEIFFYNVAKDKFYKIQTNLSFKDIFISPNGAYALLYSMSAKNCVIELFDIKKEKSLKTDYLSNLNLSCQILPSVDDKGNIAYIEKDQFYLIDFMANDSQRWHEKKRVDFKLGKIPLLYRLEAIGDKIYYLTVGNAGSYTLYKIDEQNWQTFSVKPSSGRIYFNQTLTTAGVITGGADNFTLNMFDVADGSKNKLAVKIQNWNEFSFYSNRQYFYILDKKLHSVIDDQTSQLPFLAEQLQSVDQNSLIILTRLGTPLKIALKDLALIQPDSLAIFQKLKLE